MTEPDILSPDALGEIQKRATSDKDEVYTYMRPWQSWAEQGLRDREALLKHIAALSRPTALGGERFFIDHGIIHDRVTGRHFTTDLSQMEFHNWTLETACEFLNSLARPTASAHVSEDVLRGILAEECDESGLRDQAKMLRGGNAVSTGHDTVWRYCALAAMRRAAAFSIRDGYVLVPKEPTQAMLDEVCSDEPLDRVYKAENIRALYKAMLSAAPSTGDKA